MIRSIGRNIKRKAEALVTKTTKTVKVALALGVAIVGFSAAAPTAHAAGVVPAEITQAIDDVEVTFSGVFAVGVTIAVAFIGLRLLKRGAGS